MSTIEERKHAYLDIGFTESWANRLSQPRTDDIGELDCPAIHSLRCFNTDESDSFDFMCWHVFKYTEEGHNFWYCALNTCEKRGLKGMMEAYPSFEDFYKQWQDRSSAERENDGYGY